MTHPHLIRPVHASLAATAIAGGCALLAGLTGCATPGAPTAAPRPAVSPQAVTVSPAAVAPAPMSAPSSANPTSAPTSADPTSPAATPAATPAANSAATPASASPSAVPAPSDPAAPAAAAEPPHFATPDAAMRYLVVAYNSSDETAIRHVTTPDSRTQFEAERQWVRTFRFRSCTANGAPAWDFTCVLDIVATMPGVDASADPSVDPATGLPVMNEVTVLVAPAARPGYYLAANQGCGG